MARKLTGKSHVGEMRETRPNGDIYVYERITAYDPKTRRTRTIATRLKGKINANTQEMVPTRPKHPKGQVGILPDAVAVRQHTGLTDLLEWAGQASGIDSDIHAAFHAGDAAKLLSIARYWVATDGNTLPRIESWQNMHNLPYPHGISEDVYCDLFKSVGCNEDGIQRYFMRRAAMLDKNPVIALDSTTISTYSENQTEARQGFNKDSDGLNTIKLVTLYSVKDREPIAFAKQPGNIPDVISVENALAQMKCFGIKTPLIVTDSGYCSEHNLAQYAKKNMKFLTIMDASSVWIRKEIDKLTDDLKQMSAVCPFDNFISGAGSTVMHTFKWQRRRNRGDKTAGEFETFTRRLHVYVFQSPERKIQREFAFKKDLMELKRQVEEGQTEFTTAAENKIAKYLICKRIGRGGQLKVSFNDDAIQTAMKYFGFFALVANQPVELFTSLEYYRLREKIEELFADQKGSFDSRRPRVWYPDNLRGRQFAQFIGLGYYCYISKKIKEVQQQLGKNKESKSEKRLKLEKQLAKWLETHSFAQIMDWFDCIETTTVITETVKVRWSTETIERDRLFLELLGVSKK
ncbi:MAG: transposase [Candidatus Babeliaceae bacterium]|nr:transposase [Candidatus Babeliaceae bacterium]